MSRPSRRAPASDDSSPMHPLGGALTGTHADNVRHAILRAHFMNALLTDPRVAALFDTWGEQTELYPTADAVADAGQRLARAAGVSHWCNLRADAAVLTADHTLAMSVETFSAAGERFTAALAALGQLDPVPFVLETLGLRWGWLAYELADSFARHVQARATGLVEQRVYTVEAKSPPAPPIELTFRTAENERIAEARDRLLGTFAEAWQTLDAAERKAIGRRPKRDTAYLGDWARWFYRARVKQPPDTIGTLARMYRAQRRRRREHISADGAHRAVQLGIKEVERLLGLGQFELTDPREN